MALRFHCFRLFYFIDQAGRNVLVGENNSVKVADYGLSRDIEDRTYYRAKTGYPLPLRWTAPETIVNHIWTASTDVYSYGVVISEVYSYGGE